MTHPFIVMYDIKSDDDDDPTRTALRKVLDELHYKKTKCDCKQNDGKNITIHFPEKAQLNKSVYGINVDDIIDPDLGFPLHPNPKNVKEYILREMKKRRYPIEVEDKLIVLDANPRSSCTKSVPHYEHNWLSCYCGLF